MKIMTIEDFSAIGERLPDVELAKVVGPYVPGDPEIIIEPMAPDDRYVIDDFYDLLPEW